MVDAVAHIAAALFVVSLGYAAFAIARVRHFTRLRGRAPAADFAEPVTLLKPLCGMEPDFAENLRSFCRQDYGTYQIVFGVRDAADPAIEVVNAIRSEFPDRDIALVVNPRVIGANFKVSNLANMMAASRHAILIVSDSDMRVTPDYIRSVVAPFRHADIGASTCLYSGSARGGLASRLGAMFINDWFFPSALIPLAFGEPRFCFGATMAIRREVLDELGGFPALADYIADDYMLGRLTCEAGYRIGFVPHVVENIVQENSIKDLFLHELRWARTIRSVQPWGYALSFVTELLAIGISAGIALYAATGSAWLLAGPIAAALGVRCALHRAVATAQQAASVSSLGLIALRDLLTLAVRVSCFFGRTVRWRAEKMEIERDSYSPRQPARLNPQGVRKTA